MFFSVNLNVWYKEYIKITFVFKIKAKVLKAIK